MGDMADLALVRGGIRTHDVDITRIKPVDISTTIKSLKRLGLIHE